MGSHDLSSSGCMKSKVRMGCFLTTLIMYQYSIGVSFQEMNVPLRLRDSHLNYPRDNLPSDKIGL